MIALLALFAPSALAGPGLTHPEGAVVTPSTAEVVYEVKNTGEVHVTYAMTYTGEANRFGWVIPVFGKVVSLHDARIDDIVTLREVSQPVVQRFEPFEGTDACNCASEVREGVDTGEPRMLEDVHVIDRGYTGHYGYDIVTANHATGLAQWFEEKGFLSLAAEDLEHYIDLGANFLTVTVLPTGEEPAEAEKAMPPLRVVYDGEGDLRYPALLGSRSGGSELTTTLYVLGGGLAELGNGWTAQAVDTLRGGLDDDPVAIWQETRALAGADKGFVLTYGKGYEGRYLTRFDTIAPVDVHDSDVVIHVSSDPGIHSTRIVLEEPGSEGGNAAIILLLPLAGAALRRRRA